MPRTDGHIEIHSIGCLWFVYYCLLFVASLSLTFYGSLYFLACLLFIVCESNGPLSSGTTFILCRTWDINVLWHYDECLFCLYRIGGTDPQSFVCVCLFVPHDQWVRQRNPVHISLHHISYFRLHNGLRMQSSFFSFHTWHFEEKWESNRHREHVMCNLNVSESMFELLGLWDTRKRPKSIRVTCGVTEEGSKLWW